MVLMIGWRTRTLSKFVLFLFLSTKLYVQSNGELHKRSISPRVHLVTYIDSKYTDVVRDGLFVNRLYAETYSYNLTVYNNESNSEALPYNDSLEYTVRSWRVGQEVDARWEKVIVTLDLMQQYNLDQPLSTYICWFDADLIVLDFSKPLNHFIRLYPDYDMILSAEIHAETGVANTGLFIMRCSSWSLSFLQSWWSQDHNVGHDQILFDRLYKSLWPGIDEHIKILPANELNTIPPAYNTLRPSDFVLHLMGERNDYRQQVFSYARQLVDVCMNASSLLHPINLYQLGLNQSYLANSFYNLSTTRANIVLHLLQSSSEQPLSLLNGAIDLAEEYRELMLQQLKVMQSPSFQRISSNNQSISLRLSKHQLVYKHLKQLWKTGIHSPLQEVQLLNLLGMLANDMLQEMQQLSSSIDIHNNTMLLYQEAESWLQLLLHHVGKTSQPAVYAMLAMLLQNKALYLSSTSRLVMDYKDDTLGFYQRAVDIYDDFILVEAANKYQHAALLQLYADALAVSNGNHELANYYYHRSSRLWEALLFAEKTWKEDHNHYARLLLQAIRLKLPLTYLQEWKDKLKTLYSLFPNEVGEVLKMLQQLQDIDPSAQEEVETNDDVAATKRKFRRKKKRMNK